MLRIQALKRRAEFSLDASLSVPDRSVTVLVGESGSGKTTLLRLLAGLEHPDEGRIELDGQTWFDGPAGVRVPAFRRSVGYVAQDYALFPHLSVFENVAFGLRALGIPAAARRTQVESVLDRIGIRDLARRRPHQLSGGQQQRAAIARALVLNPRLLLFDEPLSALDLQTRRSVRGELRRLLADLPCVTVYVTHSPTEALALGQWIAVLEAGRVSQEGSRDDLMRSPRSPYVAEFLGVNFFRGTITERAREGVARVAVDGGELVVPDPGREGEVVLVVHPREIVLSRERPEGSARNVFFGPIDEIVPEPPAGELVRVVLASRPPLVAQVTRESANALALSAGTRIYAAFKASGVTIVS